MQSSDRPFPLRIARPVEDGLRDVLRELSAQTPLASDYLSPEEFDALMDAVDRGDRVLALQSVARRFLAMPLAVAETTLVQGLLVGMQNDVRSLFGDVAT